MKEMVIKGTIRLSEPGSHRTARRFSTFVRENSEVLLQYFGMKLFPGSLNVDVPFPENLQVELDAKRPQPAFVIPRAELRGMPDYIGDGQAWHCILQCSKIPEPQKCWVFRRIGSRVPPGVIEVLATEELVKPYSLCHGDAVTLSLVVATD